jgi:hypothetical protein
MKLFMFDPIAHQEFYHQNDWVHIPQGVTPEFLDFASHQVASLLGTHGVRREGISVSKDQFVFELGDGQKLLEQIFAAVATLCGKRADKLTLSERHVNVYAEDASPSPRPHKDRFASQVSMGISLAVPAGSHLVLWPTEARDVNPLQRAGLAESLANVDAPETALAGAAEVAIFDSPGDVVVFPGSSIWHTRRKPAGAVVLYFKLNDFGSDPLAEDPRSAGIRARSLALLDSRDLWTASGVLSLGFESVTREYALTSGDEWLNVNVWGRQPVRISVEEFDVLREFRVKMPLVDPLRKVPVNESDVRRLVQIGAIDLVPVTDG